MNYQQSPPLVLIADDDDDDVAFLHSAFAEIKTPIELIRCANGRDLLVQLEKLSVEPSLVILDLNMPVRDGREALRDIRRTAKWATIPVVVFSTCNQPYDKVNCLQLGANEYFTKPYEYVGYIAIAKEMLTRWILPE